MPFQLFDRVRESNVITGTGNVSLGGSVSGYRTFASVMSAGNTTWYALIDNTANTWEVGLGTFNTGTPNTLSRTTVLSSSNSGSLVNFGGNTCDCFMDIPASAVGTNLALSAIGVTSNGQLSSESLPANGVILSAVIRETAGYNVNISLGSTLGASDVLSALIVTASEALAIPLSSFSKAWFSASVPQAIYVTSASWGSASINISLAYQVGP